MVERYIPEKRTTTEREIIRSEEFPKNPEERLAAILAGFANSETKAITLLLLEEGPKTPSDLWQEFLDSTDRCWKLHHEAPKAYCTKSLVPIGMVAEELFMSMGVLEFTVGYTVTEAGKHYGQPIAAFLLKKAVEYKQSFYPIFGPTHSCGTSRAPFRRAKILEFIVQSPDPLRVIDIENLSFLKRNVVGRHLQALDEAGLIRYYSVDTEESGFARYQWQPKSRFEEVKPVWHFSWLTPQVAQILAQEKKAMNRQDVQEILQGLFPEKIFNESIISSILCGLYEQGLVSARFQGGKRQSEIKLLEKGEQVYQEILLPIREALNDGPTLEKMRSLLPNWRLSASEAASLYKEASPWARKEPSSVWQRRILGLLKVHPGGLRPKEVASALDNFAPPRAYFHLSRLYRQGLVERKKEGRATRYFLVEKPQKPN